MKKNDVETGATYVAKVSDKLARVRIERESPHGGWDATNVDTGRRVRIKSAQRLRFEVGAKRGHTAQAAAGDEAQYNDDVCETVGCGRPSALRYLGRLRCQECYEADVAEAPEAGPAAEADVDQPPLAGDGEKSAKSRRAQKVTGEPQPKRLSVLDAAARVLASAGRPMRAKELVAAMAEQGLWASPNGKTPEATLCAAILREIGTKGDAARFRKVERGQFASTATVEA